MHAYIAGPLFNEGERWFDEQIEARAARTGFETYLPHRDTAEHHFPPVRTSEEIFQADVQAIDRAVIVIANLNGFTTDDGTAWELGYAYARGKHLVGIYTDMRQRFAQFTINPMIGGALHKLVRSLDELETYLKAYVQAESL